MWTGHHRQNGLCIAITFLPMSHGPLNLLFLGKPSCSTSLQSFIAYWNTSKTHQALYSSVFFPTHIVQCNLLLLSTQSTNSCHDVYAPGWWCFKMLFISFRFCSFFLAPWWMSWIWSVFRHRSLRLIFMLTHEAKQEGLVRTVTLKIPPQPNHWRLWYHGVFTCCRAKGLLFGKYQLLSLCMCSKQAYHRNGKLGSVVPWEIKLKCSLNCLVLWQFRKY